VKFNCVYHIKCQYGIRRSLGVLNITESSKYVEKWVEKFSVKYYIQGVPGGMCQTSAGCSSC